MNLPTPSRSLRSASAWVILSCSLSLSTASAAAQSCDFLSAIGDREVELLSFDGRIAIERSLTAVSRVVDGEDPIQLQSLGYIGDLNDISRDGEFVVGVSALQVHEDDHACRWNPDGSFQDLGTLGGAESVAIACSDDGNVVVGSSRDASGVWRAFRWDPTAGLQALPIAGDTTFAADVSADGTVIVGTSNVGSFPTIVSQMWRWTQAGGVQYLGGFEGDSTIAQLVSGNGAVLVGSAVEGQSRNVLRWTAAGGYEEIQDFQSSVVLEFAGVSTDGSTIGYSWLDFNVNSYLWREGVGRRFVSSMGDDWLMDLSEDGTVGVGRSVISSPTVNYATVWDFESATSGFPSENFQAAPDDYIELSVVSGDGSVAGGYFSSSIPTHTRTAFLTPLSVAIADRYCAPAVVNSSGCGASVSAHGSASASITDLRLSAGSLPPGAAGYFLTSMVQASVFPVPGSQGRLCLGGSIGRLAGPGQVFVANAAGRASVSVTSGALPTPTGATTVMAGDTWNFQAWFRDANPGSTSNFSDAVTVTFN